MKELISKLYNISVCIATYNGANFIEKQLVSIFNQTLKPYEIIICDDCSTDNTIKIIEKYSDKNIKLYKNNSQLGVIKNFEKAISICKGDYIALSDQDDIWNKNKLQIQMSEIINEEIKKGKDFPILCVHDLSLIFENNTLIEESLWEKLGNNPWIPNNNILFTNKYYGCTMLFNKALKDAILPFPTTLPMHDHWIALNAYVLGEIVTIKKPLIYYRRHNANITSLVNKENIFRRLFHYFRNIKGSDYKQKEILQAYELLKKHPNLISKQKLDEMKTIIKISKYNNLIRKLYFSYKYRFSK
jgi:glycosyltransferase involved in cell wall biosynthesis